MDPIHYFTADNVDFQVTVQRSLDAITELERHATALQQEINRRMEKFGELRNEARTAEKEQIHQMFTKLRRLTEQKMNISEKAFNMALKVDNDISDNEKFCTCQRGSFGEMIQCDGKQCPYDWFHFGCVGLEVAPPDNEKWLCSNCKSQKRKTMIKRKRGRSLLRHKNELKFVQMKRKKLAACVGRRK